MSKYGPNVTKLIIKFLSREAIPIGGGLADGIEFFTNPERRKQVLAKAESGALEAVRLIKIAPDNLYGDNDEVIAGVLLKKIDERKRK